MPIGYQAQAALKGCIGCSRGSVAGVGELATGWWGKIPTWAKILGGVVLTGGLVVGVVKLIR